MLLLEVYIYKIDKKKIANSDSITETQDDSDWEEIENQ
jgi:hypothetical protein